MNANNAVVLTNEAQPPPIFATNVGLKLTILQRNVGQKWLVSCSQPHGHNYNTSIRNIIKKASRFLTQTVQFYWIEPLPFPKWYRRALVRTFLCQAGSRIAGMWRQVGGKLHSRL